MNEPLSPDSSVVKPSGGKTPDDIVEMFKELDSEEKEVPPKKEPKEDKKVKEPEVGDDVDAEGEDDDIKLKDAEDDEEKLDLEEKSDDEIGDIDAPPRKKEILAKYPDLFKTFPFMEKMMYRDKQYTELFGSFDDAKEIAGKAEVFNAFESQLLAGNTEEILKELKTSDERAFNIVVDDYLQTLHKVDKDAYFHVVGNLNKRLIMEMVEEANNSENDDLKQAAILVKQFLFGNGKFTAPSKLVENRDQPKNDEVEKERLDFVKERYDTAREDLQTQVDNTLRATITDYIDPKGLMSSYVKKNAVADAMRILEDSIASDTGTAANLKKLWKSSFDAKFSKDSLGKIKSYYLSRAKGNLKNAIVKARAEALKDSSAPRRKESEDNSLDEETQPKAEQRRRQETGRPSQSKGKHEIKKGESVTDFFMRD